MKRIKRNPEKYAPLEVYSELSRGRDYKLHVQEDFDAFMTNFGELLKASQNNESLVHGKRVEALFGNLVAGLGGCKFIKSEDTGEGFATDADIQPPDYKLILNDGTSIFVEVKNCNQSRPQASLLLHKENIDKIERYSELHGIPVYYAIYYRCINRWAMLPKSAFIELKRKYATNLVHSLANNTMGMLGDLMVGTKPNLIFELIADKNKDTSISDNNQAKFIIGDVKIYCDGNEVNDSYEKNMAFYFMRFGDWDCGDAEAILEENGKLHSVRYTFKPNDPDNAELNGFSFIGNLSSMITTAFNELTVNEQQVTAIDTILEPHDFSITIPRDYKGKNLPLWLISQQPNTDFNTLDNTGQ
ncbi:hypothetical protein [Proteus mirabilis]|uniref:hypothetical protein n=1 Tax=Proteus mirabilis TaxID=584 RepID=UPI0024B9D019|nr:hypothetical protein [Proteus mirabilis]